MLQNCAVEASCDQKVKYLYIIADRRRAWRGGGSWAEQRGVTLSL